MATNSVIILQGYCSVGFARVVEQSEKSDSIEYKDLRSEIHTSYYYIKQASPQHGKLKKLRLSFCSALGLHYL